MKTYSKDDRFSGDDSEWRALGQYFRDLQKKGVRFGDGIQVRGNPAPRSGVRIVHNKMLGGWFIVRGPHQTPISGRFDTKAEAQAWLKRNNKNPSARKKKAAAKKKPAAKKKAPARKKIAVTAKSRATGKPPSARLKKRRAANKVPGAYPNPAARGVSSKIYAIATHGGEPRIYVFDGAKFVPSWAEGKAYKTAAAASKVMHAMREKLPRNVEKVGVFPGYLSDSTIYREMTGKNRGMGK